MKACPNCNQPVEEGKNRCPNCGADTRSLWQEQPAGAQHLEPNLDFGQRKRQDRRELMFGFVLSLALSCALPIFFIGGALSFITYLCTCKRHPYFARGIMWGGIAGIFGATAVCTLMFRAYPLNLIYK